MFVFNTYVHTSGWIESTESHARDVRWRCLFTCVGASRGHLCYSTGVLFGAQGMTALHVSASEGRLQCVRLLVERYGFDLNQPSKPHRLTPLHLCCSGRQSDEQTALRCLNYLLSAGANPSLYADVSSTLVTARCTLVQSAVLR